MNIEIKNRFNGNIIIVGEYASIKEALEKNRGADLFGANLRGANLFESDLRGANLFESDLRGADLRGADLRGANLFESDIRGADLRGADLRGADLFGADLRGAKNIELPIITIIGSKHTFQYLNKMIKIGCHEYSTDYWIEKYIVIGKNEGYTEEQISEYGRYITMIKNLKEENN